MATAKDPQYDHLLNAIRTLYEKHQLLEAKHEKLNEEVSLLRQQVAANSRRQNSDSGYVSSLNQTGGATGCDRNIIPTSKKHPSKSGSHMQPLFVNTNTGLTPAATQSPVQLNSDPPTNVQRPHPSQPGRKKPLKFADICRSEKPTRHLFSHTEVPQETDFINVLRQCGVDINPATIAAVSSASRVQRGIEWTRPVGLHTVFILDISESMNGQGFNLLKKFVNSLLTGMECTEKECGLYEYVSLITCGTITGIMQDFTNDYQEVKNKIDRLQFSGRTPLLTALTLALCYLELQGENVMVGAYSITPRVIVVSDFDISTDKQPFHCAEGDRSEDKVQIQNKAITLGKAQIKAHGYSMVGAPVGGCDLSFAKEFSSSCGGSVMNNSADIHDATYYYRHQIAAGCAISEYDIRADRGNDQDIGGLVQKYMDLLHLNQSDQNAVMKLVDGEMEGLDEPELVNAVENDARLSSSASSFGEPSSHIPQGHVQHVQTGEQYSRVPLGHVQHVQTGEQYSRVPQGHVQHVQTESLPDLPEWQTPRNLVNISLEESFGLPPIGSRVMRGKDWKSNNDDNNGQGTIVGHKDKGIAYVLWDNEQFGEYRLGLDSLYEIQKTDETRHVALGQIELGCKIVREKPVKLKLVKFAVTCCLIDSFENNAKYGRKVFTDVVFTGDDWERGDEDGGGTVGVVVRKLRGRYVQVRWPSRVVENYRFGAENKWDVKVIDSDPQQELSQSQQTVQYEVSPSRNAFQHEESPSRNTLQPEISPSRNTSWVMPQSNTSQTDFVPSTNTTLTQSGPAQQRSPSNVALKPWWSYKDSSDQWRTFFDDNVEKLEQKRNAGQANCMIHYRSKGIRVFLNEFQCEIDGKRLDVKREMLKQEDIDSLKSIEEFLGSLD